MSKEKKQKSTFTTKLYEIASADGLRPIMQCIYFKDGFAYAADGWVSIRQSLEYHSVYNPEMLDGKLLHRNDYKSAMGFEEVVCTDEGLECINENGQKVFFYYVNPTEETGGYPSIHKVFNRLPGQTHLSFIGINPKLIERVSRALAGPSDKGLRMQFTGIDTYLVIDVIDYPDQTALIMPKILEPDLL